MNKNANLCLDVVRDSLRDKRGEYQSGAELMADITKAIFWAGVENDPFGEGEDFNMLDVWSMFGDTCKLDRYVDYSREYLATAKENIITACYVNTSLCYTLHCVILRAKETNRLIEGLEL